MPSPFPGMDPYLEGNRTWPDFALSLATEIGKELNHRLPEGSYARLESCPEIRFVEIRDSNRDHQLVTLIEVVSPSNKRPGKDREAYLAKQAEVLASDASLVEIDLLRSGERLFTGEGLADCIQRHVPTADYVVAVNRAWNREKSRLYMVNIRQPLPVIQVPLREGEQEVVLDLQYIVNQAYDRGPYLRGAVDYRRPPSVPLAAEDVDWASDRLATLRGGTSQES